MRWNGIGDDGARAIAGALERNNTLTELYLYDNGIGDRLMDDIRSQVECNRACTELQKRLGPLYGWWLVRLAERKLEGDGYGPQWLEGRGQKRLRDDE